MLGQIGSAQCRVNDSSLIAVEVVNESQKLICPRCLQYGIIRLNRICSPTRYACAIATRLPGANEVLGGLLNQAERETKLGPRHWQTEQTKTVLKTRSRRFHSAEVHLSFPKHKIRGCQPPGRYRKVFLLRKL